MPNLIKLIDALRKHPSETQWIEFKHNNSDLEMIGKDISALANSATLYDKEKAYMLWGIDDGTHDVVGTSFTLQNLKRGNEEAESWLRRMLSKNVDFSFREEIIDDKMVGVLIISKALNQPVTFEKNAFIRVGSYTKRLQEHPALETTLWDKLRNEKFEEQPAKQDLDLREALSLLDYSVYFDLLSIQNPTDISGIEHYLTEDGIIQKQDNDLYSITNLGAILFAKKLTSFPHLSRKAVRVVQYAGNNKLDLLKEDVGGKGYVVGFEGLLKYIEALLPSKEEITDSIRKTISPYPPLALREAVANALIHQDFSITGTGPVIELFASRLEITNPGTPLIDVLRIVDNPPKSRNEKIAYLMRRLGICEELGSGWDKIILSCEEAFLPSPEIEVYKENTKVTFFSNKAYSQFSTEEKLHACYFHACIQYVQKEYLTNASLRQRFNLGEEAKVSISRLIKDAVDKKLIKIFDPETAPRYMRYVPFWA